MIYKWSIILLLVHLVYFSTAQIVTERPTQSESAVNVPKGTFQIEGGGALQFQSSRNGNSMDIVMPTTLMRLGVTGGVEFRLLNQLQARYASPLFEPGMADMVAGLKFQVLDKETSGTKVAFLSYLNIPTGSFQYTRSVVGFINKISVSHSIGKYASIGYNIGHNFFNHESPGHLLYTLSFGYAFTDKVAFFIEPYGELPQFEDITANINSGMTYLLNDNLQFDLSFGTGLTRTMNFFSFGVSWRAVRQ